MTGLVWSFSPSVIYGRLLLVQQAEGSRSSPRTDKPATSSSSRANSSTIGGGCVRVMVIFLFFKQNKCRTVLSFSGYILNPEDHASSGSIKGSCWAANSTVARFDLRKSIKLGAQGGGSLKLWRADFILRPAYARRIQPIDYKTIPQKWNPTNNFPSCNTSLSGFILSEASLEICFKSICGTPSAFPLCLWKIFEIDLCDAEGFDGIGLVSNAWSSIASSEISSIPESGSRLRFLWRTGVTDLLSAYLRGYNGVRVRSGSSISRTWTPELRRGL